MNLCFVHLFAVCPQHKKQDPHLSSGARGEAHTVPMQQPGAPTTTNPAEGPALRANVYNAFGVVIGEVVSSPSADQELVQALARELIEEASGNAAVNPHP